MAVDTIKQRDDVGVALHDHGLPEGILPLRCDCKLPRIRPFLEKKAHHLGVALHASNVQWG